MGACEVYRLLLHIGCLRGGAGIDRPRLVCARCRLALQQITSRIITGQKSSEIYPEIRHEFILCAKALPAMLHSCPGKAGRSVHQCTVAVLMQSTMWVPFLACYDVQLRQSTGFWLTLFGLN